MSFFGKEFKLYKQENFDQFVNSLPVSEDFKKVLAASKSTLKVVKNGDGSYTLYISKPDNSIKEVTFKDGVEFDEQIKDAPNSKSTITVDGNVFNQVQVFDNGGKIVTKREFSDNEVIVSISTSEWDGVARRYYKPE